MWALSTTPIPTRKPCSPKAAGNRSITKRLQVWEAGERYAQSVIKDVNRWTVGWTDWNILLDEQGGPNHVGNFCFAPVHADTRTDSLIFMNSFYYLGHFSKFIRPGAVRILCAPTRDELEATAFRNPDGSIALVVLNRSKRFDSVRDPIRREGGEDRRAPRGRSGPSSFNSCPES